MKNPFRYFKTSPEVICLAVMMYVRFPLSLRNVEDLLHERGIDLSRETVRFWWNRFGPMLALSIPSEPLRVLAAKPLLASRGAITSISSVTSTTETGSRGTGKTRTHRAIDMCIA